MATIVVNIYSKIVLPTYGITPGIFRNVTMTESKYLDLISRFYKDRFEIYPSIKDPHMVKSGPVSEESKVQVSITTLDGSILKLSEIPEYIKALKDTVKTLEDKLSSTESLLKNITEDKNRANKYSSNLYGSFDNKQIVRIKTVKRV
jgi:hypothetical protein